MYNMCILVLIKRFVFEMPQSIPYKNMKKYLILVHYKNTLFTITSPGVHGNNAPRCTNGCYAKQLRAYSAQNGSALSCYGGFDGLDLRCLFHCDARLARYPQSVSIGQIVL